MADVVDSDAALYTAPALESSIAPESSPIKRVFFRLRANRNEWTAIQIVNKFLEAAGLPLAKNILDPHFIHKMPQELDMRVYHIILDVNSAASTTEPKIQDIPHELYRVHFKEGDPVLNPYARD